MINPSIFKAYDIRGIYNTDFGDDFAYQLGLAYCKMRREELGWDSFSVVVGRDMRLSSPALHKRLIEGLIDGGADIIDIGLCSTPTFYFAVAYYRYDGGIMISASHNPKEWNGFKMVRQMASPISENSGIRDLQRLILDEPASVHPIKGTVFERNAVLQDQIKHDLSYVDISKIKPLKLVVDTANAMGAPYFEALFQKLSQLEIEKMNWELDGTFPNHEADPFKKENIKVLCERVKETKADLGVATDGDSDRIFFVDNEGAPIDPGITRAILCKIFLRDKPNSTIAYDVRPGRITLDTILANGGTPLVTRVGHSLIKEAVIDAGAYFAGESSGHFMLNMDEEGCYEVPGIVLLKLLVELSSIDEPFSAYIKSFKKYVNSGEISLRVENPKEIISLMKEKYIEGKINELDGLSVEYPDVWFNVRASNTEPLLRFSVEGINAGVVEEKKQELQAIIDKQSVLN